MNRRFVVTLLPLLIASSAAGSASAQTPAAAGSVKWIVGYPAGGGADAVARLLSEKLKAELGVNVIVENRTGAGGQIAAEFVKNAPADGLTVLQVNQHMMVTLPLTSRSIRYDPLKDFTPVGRLSSFHLGIAVASNVPAVNFAQWIDWARADVKNANYGVPAAGSIPQFIGYRLGVQHKIPLSAVPYRGAAPMIQDLLGAQVPTGITSVGDLAQHHRAGKLKVLAVDGQQRYEGLPDVPTLKELGHAGFDTLEWSGLVMPPNTPRAVIDRWQPILARVLAMPDIREKMAKLGYDVVPGSSETLRTLIADGLATWGPVIKASGFVAE